MPDSPKQRPLPDVLLERYLAGDLSDERRLEVEEAVKLNGETAERLALLEKGRAEFLLADPPEQFAHRIVAKVELDRVTGGADSGFAWDRLFKVFALPSVAMAAVAVFAITISDDLQETTPLEEAVYLEKKAAQHEPASLADGTERPTTDVGQINKAKKRTRPNLPVKARKKEGSPPRLALPKAMKGAKTKRIAAPLQRAQKETSRAMAQKPASTGSVFLNEGEQSTRRVEQQEPSPTAKGELVADSSNAGAPKVGVTGGDGSAMTARSLKSLLMSGGQRSGAATSPKFLLKQDRKTRARTALSRALSVGTEIAFSSPAKGHCMVVKVDVDKDRIEVLSGSSSLVTKKGENRILLQSGTREKGFGPNTYVVTSTRRFKPSGIKLLNNLPQLERDWAGTLKVFHRLSVPK